MKKTLILISLATFAGGASADSWLYGGIQAGQSNFASEKGTAFGIHAGTGILPIFGLEAGYFNHGSIDLTLSGDSNQKGSADASSFYFATKPSIDFGPFHIYAKGGINSYKVSYSGALDSISDDTGVGVMYGVGAEYSILPGITVGASYQSFGLKIEDSSDRVNSMTLNATLHFL
ncbi:porin family protein [Vibrio sp. RE86]|uniref:porin family protein n=1 Tax=Vibrio sp. RE86 TaxID=2607605 RepID=UPI0014936890|nr:porin family protein [Vibrio sp. RE86]NOH80525.1 porin family protein [Vibrio sp. RE86]